MPRLTPEEAIRRRAVKREAVRRVMAGETSYAVAKDLPVSRQTIDQYVEEATRDPEASYRNALDEYKFRREVYEMRGPSTTPPERPTV